MESARLMLLGLVLIVVRRCSVRRWTLTHEVLRGARRAGHPLRAIGGFLLWAIAPRSCHDDGKIGAAGCKETGCEQPPGFASKGFCGSGCRFTEEGGGHGKGVLAKAFWGSGSAAARRGCRSGGSREWRRLARSAAAEGAECTPEPWADGSRRRPWLCLRR